MDRGKTKGNRGRVIRNSGSQKEKKSDRNRKSTGIYSRKRDNEVQKKPKRNRRKAGRNLPEIESQKEAAGAAKEQ